MRMQSYDVIIIGAGAAGLVAAQQIVRAGLSVVVLEAQPYIGGRVKTYHEWGRPLELGAEFIHGGQTITARLAQGLGLTVVSAHEDRKLVDEAGKELRHANKQVYYHLMDHVYASGKQGLSVQEIIDRNPVTADPLVQRLASLSAGDYEAGDADKLDSGAFSDMYQQTRYNGDNLLLADGYQQLIEALANGLAIQLEHVVTKVDYQDQRVAVTLADGIVYDAPQVVITVSLGVLQAGVIEFVPALPFEKRRVITRLGMGNAMKFLLRLRNPHDVKSLFHYADGDNESAQTITCWWASGSDPRVLVGYCGGSRAAAALALPEARLLDKVVADLSAVMGKRLADEVIDYRIVRWDTNPFVRGAYSNHPVGVGLRERRDLALPTADRLFWAGEATVDTGNYATVHSAIESGYRVAEELLATRDHGTPTRTLANEDAT